MIFLFWLSIITLAYIYFGYPIYIFVRAKFSRNIVHKDIGYKPFVSIIFSAYNEEKFVERKIDNLLKSDYPKDKLEILVGSDGSRDGTNSMLTRISGDKMRAFIFPKRRGKVSVLNDLAPKAMGEILVFCDTRQMFETGAISNLAANFADPRVGCVSGELIFEGAFSRNGVSEGIGIYWDYEKLMRRCESAVHSMVGATGAIYAIRRKLYTPPPMNTILDDIYVPLSVVRKGYRSIWDSGARAYDRPAFTPEEEYKRKVRTLAGNYQIFIMFKDLLAPLKSPVAIPILSHKLGRVLAPFFMITMLIANILIAKKDFYASALICQVVFYMLAILGGMTYKDYRKRALTRVASTIYMFCLLNFTALAGFYRFIFGKQDIAWEK